MAYPAIPHTVVAGVSWCALLAFLCCWIPAYGTSADLAEEYTVIHSEDPPRPVMNAEEASQNTSVNGSTEENQTDTSLAIAESSDAEGQSISAPESMPPPPEDVCEDVHALDLVEAQRQAISANPSLAAGAERVYQAKQLVAMARSMYYPQIDLNYTYTWTWLPSSYTDPLNDYLDQTQDLVSDIRRQMYWYTVSNTLPREFDRRNLRSWLNSSDDALNRARKYLDSPYENASMNITAGWLLFDGFAREFANAMAKHAFQEAQAAYKDGQRILLDAVAQAYYGGQYAREQVVVAEAAITFFERLRKEAQVRRDVGRAATSDVLNFETALYAARGNLLRATREHELARIALAVLIGEEEGYLNEHIQLAALEEESPDIMVVPDTEAMLELAFACRPDLEQKELGLKRARASVRREYAQYSPQVAAIAMAQTANINENSFDSDRIVSTVGINVSVNLFAGGRRKAQVTTAKHARKEAEWYIVESEQKIASEVRAALLDLKIAQEALTLQLEAASCVEKNRDLVEKEYNAGKAMLVRLNQAQNDYVQAMGLLAQARVNLHRCWQALHTATGVSLDVIRKDPREDGLDDD
ncbi:MAG: TolC family protein [Candidatus Hydrogenedens sp.]|nr:TolC family protein [Candidatus Hydrogenedens sp.]